MIKKYRRTPLELEAVHWDGTEETYNQLKLWGVCFSGRSTLRSLRIKTLEGNFYVQKNSWIIKGINGEFWACDNKIFNKTYSEVK